MTDSAWQAIGSIIVALLTFLGMLVTMLKQKDAPKSQLRQEAEETHGSLDGVPEALVRVITSQDTKILAHEQRIGALESDIAHERAFSGALDLHIDDMIRGHATGEYPPFPPKPQRNHL